MERKENKEEKTGNRTKLEITVPFLWEEKPGAPKESWKTPKREPFTPVPQPVKYVASVPFKWEEKPGMPLRCFAQETKEYDVHDKVLEKKSLPLPPAYYAKYGNESDEESSYSNDCDYQDWLSEMDFEALSFLSEESLSTAPSLLQAKQPTPSSVEVPSAVPLQNPFVVRQSYRYMEASSSPESSNSPSCGSKNASLKGASSLKHIFPLYPPKSGFLDKPDNSEECEDNCGHIQYGNERRLPTLEEYRKHDAEFRHSGLIRRPVTLGELMMQSRRRSYRRKAVQAKINNSLKEFNEDRPRGCFNLGGSGGLPKLLGKNLLTLKHS